MEGVVLRQGRPRAAAAVKTSRGGWQAAVTARMHTDLLVIEWRNEAEAAGLPAYSCACRLGRPLSKRAARRYLELLNGGDPSGSDKQIQIDTGTYSLAVL